METDHWKTLCAGVDNAYLILEAKNIAGLKQKTVTQIRAGNYTDFFWH